MTPVYQKGGVLKHALLTINKNYLDGLNTNPVGTGFRLPSSAEWELAARYKDGTDWTPGNYASGAAADYNNTEATRAVAWYRANCNTDPSQPDLYFTQPVGQKAPNALGLYDMSGNVWEWCFDKYDDSRVFRGGTWIDDADCQWLGLVERHSPEIGGRFDGFRPARTK